MYGITRAENQCSALETNITGVAFAIKK